LKLVNDSSDKYLSVLSKSSFETIELKV